MSKQIGGVIVAEFDQLDDCEHEMDMHGFVAWLIEVERVENISTRELDCLAWEYCLLHDRKPLSPRRQHQACKVAGLIPERPTIAYLDADGNRRERRPTVYHVAPLVMFQHDVGRQKAA